MIRGSLCKTKMKIVEKKTLPHAGFFFFWCSFADTMFALAFCVNLAYLSRVVVNLSFPTLFHWRSVMRFLLKASMPVEAGNAAAKEGRFALIESILAEMKPEAVYFLTENGQRTALVFFEMHDASEMPKIGEPWMLAFNASIDVHPVMVPADLKKAAPDIEQVVKKYT